VPLPAGGGDGALTNAKQGHHLTKPFVFPAAWMKRGGNELVLVTTEGSWILYDSVKLDAGVPNGPQVDHIGAACTPMFKSVDGVMKQAVLVRIANEGLDGEGQVARVVGEHVREVHELRQRLVLGVVRRHIPRAAAAENHARSDHTASHAARDKTWRVSRLKPISPPGTPALRAGLWLDRVHDP